MDPVAKVASVPPSIWKSTWKHFRTASSENRLSMRAIGETRTRTVLPTGT